MLLIQELPNILKKEMKMDYLSVVSHLAQICGLSLWMQALDLLLKFMNSHKVFFTRLLDGICL